MQLIPHLSFNGECEEAFRFYEKCLRGKILFMRTYGDSPGASEVPPAWGKKIIHATIAIGEQPVMGADTPNYEPPRGFSMVLNAKDAEEAERVFKDLAEGGTVRMVLQETFWAERFGMVTDRFGVPWQINCGKTR